MGEGQDSKEGMETGQTVKEDSMRCENCFSVRDKGDGKEFSERTWS